MREREREREREKEKSWKEKKRDFTSSEQPAVIFRFFSIKKRGRKKYRKFDRAKIGPFFLSLPRREKNNVSLI